MEQMNEKHAPTKKKKKKKNETRQHVLQKAQWEVDKRHRVKGINRMYGVLVFS